MITRHTSNQADSLVEQAAMKADHAIQATQHATDQALNGLAEQVEALRQSASPVLHRVGAEASAMGRDSLAAMEATARQIRDGARHAGDSTTTYIRDQPVKSVLMAAAGGAFLVGLLNLLRRR